MRVSRARKACAQALQTFLVRPDFLGPWPPTFRSDPFVLGYVFAVTALVSRISSSDKLTRGEQESVINGALADVGWNPTEFLELVGKEMGTDAYRLGLRNAETVITYVFNLHPMTGDTDVAEATEFARATALGPGPLDRAAIGGALMQLLFFQVVKKRLG